MDGFGIDYRYPGDRYGILQMDMVLQEVDMDVLEMVMIEELVEVLEEVVMVMQQMHQQLMYVECLFS